MRCGNIWTVRESNQLLSGIPLERRLKRLNRIKLFGISFAFLDFHLFFGMLSQGEFTLLMSLSAMEGWSIPYVLYIKATLKHLTTFSLSARTLLSIIITRGPCHWKRLPTWWTIMLHKVSRYSLSTIMSHIVRIVFIATVYKIRLEC